LIPNAIASRRTAKAASWFFGGPKTPGPASCMAPYPSRFTRLLPSEKALELSVSAMSKVLCLVVTKEYI
jgi:hypothetical protein